MNDAVLECVGLTKSYKEDSARLEVLKGLNLSVMAGERVAIVGRSGDRKSVV